MEIYDISIPLNDETPVWEGDRGVSISHPESITEGDDFNVSRMEMGVHAGTHIDAPKHLFDDGYTVDQIDLKHLIGPVQVLEIPENISIIEPRHLEDHGYQREVKRILLKTANSNYWLSDPFSFHKEFAAINKECAEMFAKDEFFLVGIDYFSISPFSNLKPPHEILLKSRITILENANLSEIDAGIYNLICLPMRITDTDGSPVRAVLTRE